MSDDKKAVIKNDQTRISNNDRDHSLGQHAIRVGESKEEDINTSEKHNLHNWILVITFLSIIFIIVLLVLISW
ncbi:MAG: hypothetical protein UMR38_05195 [Candidatus Izemoplasma sp.]|nr:hypothetical protein [Candidatus Izemoplasma sp.]